MTTASPIMRYLDVGVTSRGRHEGEKQTGRGDQATRACGSAAARGQESRGGGTGGRRTPANGVPLARGARSRRHRGAARHEQGRTPGATGGGRIVALICDVTRGGCGTRFCHAALDAQAGAACDRTRIRGAVQRGPCVALARAAGAIQPEAGSTRLGTRRRGHRALAQAHLAGAKKTPLAKED